MILKLSSCETNKIIKYDINFIRCPLDSMVSFGKKRLWGTKLGI